jgi:ribonuclease P protein component
MLPKSHRIPALDIPLVMKRGTRFVGNGLTFVYRKRVGESRFAFIVSTKVDKKAVVRNRMRRVLSESVGHLMDSLPAPLDGIFIGSKEMIGLTQKEVEVRVASIFSQIT